MNVIHASRSGLLGGACALALSCSATSNRPDPNAADAGADSGSGSSGSGASAGVGAAGAGGDGPEPVPTTIALENTGTEPLIVGSQCGGTFLTLSHEGEELAFDRSCSCPCDDHDACGCPAFCPNTQELVVPGERASREWDGLFAHFDDPACYELRSLARGDTVTAAGCWTGGAEGAARSCETVDFAYGDEREVTIPAEHHTAARTPMLVVLDNQTGGPIQIVTDECGSQAWVELSLPNDRGASLSEFCPCSCNADFELEPVGCPVCGGCAEPVAETVPAGGTHVFEWDGMFWNRYPSGCANRYAMPAGYGVSAEVCFTRRGETARTCQPFFFVLGELDQVTVTVQ
jgi:hypothetical protein